jgi:hypothetical protein
MLGDRVGGRSHGWLTHHDNLKIAAEYNTGAAVLENLRLLLSIAMNGSLLQRFLVNPPTGLMAEYGFVETEILGEHVFVPSEKRFRSLLIDPFIDPKLEELDNSFAQHLWEIEQIPSIAVIDVGAIELNSPIRLKFNLWPAIRSRKKQLAETEQKAFGIASRMVTYGTLLVVITGLYAAAEVPNPDIASEQQCVSVEFTGLSQGNAATLCEDARMLADQLRSNSESARTEAQQRALSSIGINPGPIDGKDGPRTRSARNKYAQRHGFANWDTDPEMLINLLALEASLSRLNAARN